MFWVLMAGFILSVLAGVIYPAGALVYYKVRHHMSVKEILEVIGW